MLRTVIRFAVLLSIGLFSTNAALAQGTFQFTWHGNSNFFQASFQVTEAEMQLGASFNSELFYDSILVTSVSGITYTDTNRSGSVGGEGNPFALGIGLFDFGHGTEVQIEAGSDLGGFIQEKPFSGPFLYTEGGHWTELYVPEPSGAALLLLGGGIIALVKRRGS
jgi:hypothetical protein